MEYKPIFYETIALGILAQYLSRLIVTERATLFTSLPNLIFLLRTWCEQEAPYWIQTTRSTGSRSRELKVVLPICSATLRITPTHWHRTSGKPIWSHSLSSRTTWVSWGAVIKLFWTCKHNHILILGLLVFPLLLVLTVDYLDVSDPERATLPRFEDIREAYPKELGSSVQFPQLNLRPQGRKGSTLCSCYFLAVLNVFKINKKKSIISITIPIQQSPRLPLKLRPIPHWRRVTQCLIGDGVILSQQPLCQLLWL